MAVVVKQNFRIVGSGSYLPQHVVTASQTDQRLGLPEGWCNEHLGVKRRYECLPPESMVTMAKTAMAQAMQDARLVWKDIDALIDCSTSQFRPIPCNAVHYQHQFGAEAQGIPCFDVQSTCLGAPVAMHLVNGLFAANAYQRVLVVASESGMGGVNPKQPESAGLIGDGAAAMVLERCETNTHCIYAHETYAEHIELCRVEGGGHKLPVFQYHSDRIQDYQFWMDGPSVFRVAITQLRPMVQRVLQAFDDQPEGLDRHALHYVPHQASPKALEAVRRLLGVAPHRFHSAVTEVGNLVAASIPFMLDRVRRQGLVRAGDKVLILGTSAGYSQAALLFEL